MKGRKFGRRPKPPDKPSRLKKPPNKKSDADRRLQAVIETAIDGIVTIDERGIVESMNPAAARLFGYTEAEVLGNNVSMLMPQPYRGEHDGYLRRYLSTRKPHIIGIGREVEGMRKDGTVFPLRLAVSEVGLDDHRIFTGIIHDLSNVKQAEEKILRLNKELEAQNEELEQKVSERTDKLAKVVDQLLQTNQKLGNEITERQAVEEALRRSEAELRALLEKEKELSELKTRFVSMASHEFRTPLSTILSSVELVEAYQNTEQQPKREKHIGRIKNAVTYLTSVLNDFLSLSKLEEGRIEVQPAFFAFGEFCQEIISELELHLKPGQTIVYDSTENDHTVFLDKRCLRHILFNLISNAIKYSPENSPIECTTKMEGGMLSIIIRDPGIGIPENDQKYLFTRFFRAHNVENIKGTGLGLNIMRRYVEMLKGSVRFESKEGVGTVFYVEIPLHGKQ